MSRPEANGILESFTASPFIPKGEERPVFAEPWEAKAFAMVLQLSEEGHFTWTEWTVALGEQLEAAVKRGDPDDGSRYFEHWITALEYLVNDKKLIDLTSLSERKEAWEAAYLRTPHGRPVNLDQKAG